MMTETYLPFASILVAVLGVVFTYFGFVVKVKGDIAALQATVASREKAIDCLPQMHADLAKLNAADDVFWKVLGPALGGIIHSPIHIRRDKLMDEWLAAPKGKIPESDLRELRDELEQMLDEAIAGDSVNLQLIGAMLLGRIEAQIEALKLVESQNKGA